MNLYPTIHEKTKIGLIERHYDHDLVFNSIDFDIHFWFCRPIRYLIELHEKIDKINNWHYIKSLKRVYQEYITTKYSTIEFESTTFAQYLQHRSPWVRVEIGIWKVIRSISWNQFSLFRVKTYIDTRYRQANSLTGSISCFFLCRNLILRTTRIDI